MLALDRPGFGMSDFVPARRLLDWPADVAGVADRLGLDRFAIVGVSGGAPYALACGRSLGDRVRRLGIVCGLGPTDDPAALDGMMWANRLGLRLARRLPWLAHPVFAALAPLFRNRPERVLEHLGSALGEEERGFFADPALRALFAATFREAFRQGWRGPARDARIYAAPWGFDLGDVRVPVRMWHGEADAIVPVGMARRVAAALPDCEATILPGEGHFSLALGRVRGMFASLGEPA